MPPPADPPPDVQNLLDALASPVRREILGLVWDRELSAGEIASAFAITKPTISQHLSVLRHSGLVSVSPQGASRRYRARREVLSALRTELGDPRRWTPADDLPERALAGAHTALAVVATVDVETDQAETFRAFTDAAVYSRWLGVPVIIDRDRFSATMEWGTEVRGRYEVVAAPWLVVMRWDFEDDNVPVPGGELTAYLRVEARPEGSHVQVHQLVESDEQARFMEAAWSLVLGRLKAGVVAASDPARAVAPRPRRPKRRRTA